MIREAAPDRIHPIPLPSATMDLANELDLSARYLAAQQRIEADRMIRKAQENHARVQETAKAPEQKPGIPKPVWFAWGILLGLLMAEAYQLAAMAGLAL